MSDGGTMSAEKFASLTANLLARKGQAIPSSIAPSQPIAFPRASECAEAAGSARGRGRSQRASKIFPRSDSSPTARAITLTLPPADSETIGFIAVKRGVTHAQLLRLTLEGCGDTVIVPVGVDPNSDGSVTLSVSDSTEHFSHDEDARGWVGDCGSFLTGDSDLFSEASGWCITISLEHGDRSVAIWHNNQRERIKFDGFPAGMFSQSMT
jgi:hypothetical protein